MTADVPPWPIADDGIRRAFAEMLVDGSWGRYHGPHCDRLRTALAAFHAVEHVHLCSSGTSAVELALRAAKVQPADEVILCAYDYKANFANVLTVGATPVLIDTVPGMPVPDINQLEDAVTDKTRAIICSHLHGSFAPVQQIQAFARERGITVIEDACQATGGRLHGRAAGAIGDIGILSFGGSKLLTAGRGGAILTSDATIAQRIRLYTQRGNDASPLSEMQAAVVLPQLHELPGRTQTRLESVRLLLDGLSRVDSFQPAIWPRLPAADESIPAFYKVAWRYCAAAANGVSRATLTKRIRDRGVALDPAFPALHRIHSQTRFRAVGELPHAFELHESLVTLHHPILLTTADELTRATGIVAEVAEASGD